VYGNEALVGEAIQPWLKEHGRDSLFLTSKFWNDAHRPQLLRCVCFSPGRRAALQHWQVVSEQDGEVRGGSGQWLAQGCHHNQDGNNARAWLHVILQACCMVHHM
jgi:hypothetical protein